MHLEGFVHRKIWQLSKEANYETVDLEELLAECATEAQERMIRRQKLLERAEASPPPISTIIIERLRRLVEQARTDLEFAMCSTEQEAIISLIRSAGGLRNVPLPAFARILKVWTDESGSSPMPALIALQNKIHRRVHGLVYQDPEVTELIEPHLDIEPIISGSISFEELAQQQRRADEIDNIILKIYRGVMAYLERDPNTDRNEFDASY